MGITGCHPDENGNKVETKAQNEQTNEERSGENGEEKEYTTTIDPTINPYKPGSSAEVDLTEKDE